MTSKQIIKQLNQAIKKFGMHSYEDQGASAVMDTKAIEDALREMTAEEAGSILKEVKESKNGSRLADDLICNLDDMHETWFNSVVKLSGAYY